MSWLAGLAAPPLRPAVAPGPSRRLGAITPVAIHRPAFVARHGRSVLPPAPLVALATDRRFEDIGVRVPARRWASPETTGDPKQRRARVTPASSPVKQPQPRTSPVPRATVPSESAAIDYSRRSTPRAPSGSTHPARSATPDRDRLRPAPRSDDLMPPPPHPEPSKPVARTDRRSRSTRPGVVLPRGGEPTIASVPAATPATTAALPVQTGELVLLPPRQVRAVPPPNDQRSMQAVPAPSRVPALAEADAPHPRPPTERHDRGVGARPAPSPAIRPPTPQAPSLTARGRISIEIGRIEIRPTARQGATPVRRVVAAREHVIDPQLPFGDGRRGA